MNAEDAGTTGQQHTERPEAGEAPATAAEDVPGGTGEDPSAGFEAREAEAAAASEAPEPEDEDDEDLDEDEDDDDELDEELVESAAASDEAVDEDAAVDLDEPDEDAPRLRHDELLDPAERAALEAAARELEEEEAEVEEAAEPDIPRHRLDTDAYKVVGRLRRFGHEAYFVGGCVRDLLLGLEPKDFDIATGAGPEEIKGIFTNCRLIGRRFRLAHIYFRGGKVIETATFRANPHQGEDAPEDLYIEQDNVYGTAEEDAFRRDFTINGLFYDPYSGRVIDYVGGREDLERRVIRTIGDPDVRMREDPVRILRAVRFAAKLNLQIDPDTFEAMRAHAEEIRRSPPPRVLEEVLRLLRCGAARGAFVLLRETGAMRVLMPPVAEYLDAADAAEQARFWALLDAMDEWIHRHADVPDDSVLLAVLLTNFFDHDELPTARSEVLDQLLDNLVRDARLPKRKAERIRLILGAQRIFAGHRKRRFSVRRFVRQSYIHDAMTLFDIRVRGTGEDLEHYRRWRYRIESGGDERGEESEGQPARRRRKRGGRKRRRPQG